MAKFTPNGVEAFIQHLPPPETPVAITQISNANPAVVTVAVGDIGKFADGDIVTIEGATGNFSVANGQQVIGNVLPAGTFDLTAVDTSAATGPAVGSLLKVVPMGDTAPSVNIQSLSNTNPSVMTVLAGDIGLFTEGKWVMIEDSNTSLDGKAFIAQIVDTPGAKVTLQGADLTGEVAPTGAVGRATPLSDDDFYKFCLSSYEYEKTAADAIDVSTFCETETLAGTPQPGNITIGGFVDFKSLAYNEWRTAVNDGRKRVWRIALPVSAGGGEIIYTITPSGYTETYNMNEGVSYSATAVVNEEPLYLV